MKREEFEASRDARRAEKKKKRDAQEELDLDAITKLEESLGVELYTENPSVFVDGSCVVIAYKAPTTEYKRYVAKVRSADKNNKARQDATDELGMSCWIYPEKDSPLRAAVLEANQGIVHSITERCIELAQLKKSADSKE